jgi:hypothetical protein
MTDLPTYISCYHLEHCKTIFGNFVTNLIKLYQCCAILGSTVEFKSIRQSRIMEGTWRVEIWSLSRVTKGYWWKVRTVTVNQIWKFWLKIGLSASKWLILALAAHHRYEFDTKHCQNVQFNSYNWRNFGDVTASKVEWRKENFVRHVTVTEGCRFDLNSTVSYNYLYSACIWMSRW